MAFRKTEEIRMIKEFINNFVIELSKKILKKSIRKIKVIIALIIITTVSSILILIFTYLILIKVYGYA